MSKNPSFPSTGVLMAIDWGGKRVGIALSDSTLTIARPVTILNREKGDSLSEPDSGTVDRLVCLAEEHSVSGIVFGVPYYHLSGDPNPKASLFLMAGQHIGKVLGLPVFFSDEGHTSSDALEISGRRGGKHKRVAHNKTFSDHVAAASLLQRFLDEIAVTRKSLAFLCEHDALGAYGKE